MKYQKEIKELTGLDVEAYKHIIDNYGVKHAMKHHGNVKIETNRKQLTKLILN